MLIWKFLHIASMFTAVTLLFAYDIVIHRSSARGDVATVRAVGKLKPLVENSGIAIFFVGVAFGIVAALVGPFDLTQGWLIAAYVLVAILLVLGAGPESAWLRQLIEAADRDTSGSASAEFTALARDPRRHLSWVSAFLYAAVIYVMVVKPFS
ncbi:MAG TPA: hypothetical protein VHI54_09405 [Actinomycetota bacterium]|nr:hypothetical protein [Actinomycetota bacterium]